MRFQVLATDYDGTLAHHGIVDDETLAAIERVRASGRKLVLVSGRELPDLKRVFPQLHLFDLAVLENGGILHFPARKETRRLAAPPPEEFVAALRRRGVEPVSVGEVIVATWEPHDVTILDTIRELGLELQVIFNKGAVMVLPSGVNKATGLKAALAELRLSPHNTVGIGDAENDHAFLAVCECAVAVSNALPSLKERADVVTVGDHGAGVRELIDALVGSDLRELEGRLGRHALLLGTTPGGSRLTFSPFAPPMLVTGTSGGGKSTLATSILEQLADRGYQFCILDPEGDYRELAGATVLGTEARVPGADEIIRVLENPDQSVVVNMIGVKLGDRPAFFDTMFARLLELRARTGRPHWIFLDEAHHLAPRERKLPQLPTPIDGLVLITVHPEHVARALLEAVATVLVIGSTPRDTLAGFAAAVGIPAPDVAPDPLPPGEAIAWQVRPVAPPVRITPPTPRTERRRHIRKYASGELGEDRSFYFRGPEGRLNLRAQNLHMFLQLADGVDDDTWMYHLRRGDYSGWFREMIKDPDLAAAAEAVERDPNLSPAESRARIRAAVEERYTAPA